MPNNQLIQYTYEDTFDPNAATTSREKVVRTEKE